MTKLAILSSHEQRRFDLPPNFNAADRAIYFSLNNGIFKVLEKLRTTTNKVGFMLQLGYFKSNGKFYTAAHFRQQDIDYVAQILSLPASPHFDAYQQKIPQDHRKKILTLLGWKSLNSEQQSRLTNHILWHVQNQLSPKQIFFLAIDYCWQNKIEIPSYHQLSLWITHAYNQYEASLIKQLENQLNNKKKEAIFSLAKLGPNKKMQRPPITLLRKINQSLEPSDIQKNTRAFSVIKNYFYQFQDIIDQLSLSDQATEYLSTWVQKSETFQLNSFSYKTKICLYLLAYIKHFYYFRQDVLIDILLKSVQTTINVTQKKLSEKERTTRSERNKTIKKLSRASKDARLLVESITEIIQSTTLSESIKLTKIESLLDHYHTDTERDKQKITLLEDTLDKIVKNQNFFDVLESLSIKLQHRVSNIMKVLEFNAHTSDGSLIEAITYFQSHDGKIHSNAPLHFLSEAEKEAVLVNGKLRVSLYKALLFIHAADAIKSGKLNLKHSYRYKAIQEYLIEKSTWDENKNNLLQDAGLYSYLDCCAVLNDLKRTLHDKYTHVNQHFLSGKNSYLNIIDNGAIKLNTPKIDNDDLEYISSLLTSVKYVPILQILSDVNQVACFTECFKHFSIKHKKMKPIHQTIYAGIIGKGCNIGIDRIANISAGITEDILKNTVNWYFNLKNLQAANNKIIAMINKLALADGFRRYQNALHTSSDGRKVNVAVDSLHASYSFKYFGKGKGVTLYTFVDERQLLFHSTVISSSEREAAYVIDGLLQNEVVKSDIHSTDTHGFTETVFAATHFIGTAFAPRIKKVAAQKIYAFKSPITYANQGYKILPSRNINQQLIETHWDDILRFMATIKLKYASASQLFKRLSSYAKDHPLYKALKEFGRVIKSQFILTYFDELELRQRIEKQLNKVELSNKFSKAVFFANNQEFKQCTKEEQEIATACMVLIQNAIVLWNYLYLSQLLANNKNIDQRQQMMTSIKQGSAMTWHHINLHGEYDFTKQTSNEIPFDMEKILALKIG